MTSDNNKLDLNDKIYFGKYREEKVKTILKDDPDYLKWALENVENFNLTKDLKEKLKNKDNKLGLNAKLSFGKHKGKKVIDIIKNEPDYIELHKEKFNKEAINTLKSIDNKNFEHLAWLSVQSCSNFPINPSDRSYYYRINFNSGMFKVFGKSKDNNKSIGNEKRYNIFTSIELNLYNSEQNKLFIKALEIGRKIIEKQRKKETEELNLETVEFNPYNIHLNLDNITSKLPIVTAGTTCSRADSGDGGETILIISNLGDNTTKFNKGYNRSLQTNIDKIKFEMKGHSECEMFSQMLEYFSQKNNFEVTAS